MTNVKAIKKSETLGELPKRDQRNKLSKNRCIKSAERIGQPRNITNLLFVK